MLDPTEYDMYSSLHIITGGTFTLTKICEAFMIVDLEQRWAILDFYFLLLFFYENSVDAL